MPFNQAESSASPCQASVFDALTAGKGGQLLLQGGLRITPQEEKITDFDWKCVQEANPVRVGWEFDLERLHRGAIKSQLACVFQPGRSSSDGWKGGKTRAADSVRPSGEFEREGRAFRSSLDCIFGYRKDGKGRPAWIGRASFGSNGWIAVSPLESDGFKEGLNWGSLAARLNRKGARYSSEGKGRLPGRT